MARYFGESPFGGQGFDRRIQATACNAVAGFVSPTVQGSSTLHPAPGSATASFPAPTVTKTHGVTAPVARATASAPFPDFHGATPRADLPTTLTVKGRITGLSLHRETTLALGRTTTLTMSLSRTLVLNEHPTALRLFRETTLLLDPGITELVPDDQERVLVLDG